MASFNKVILMGNLTRDPDLRSTPSGSPVCELGIATNRRFVVNGQERDESCFVDITVWGKSAENCKRFLEKGSQVLIEGRLQLDQWEDREGGGRRSKLRVVAETVQFLGARRSNSNDNGDSYNGGNYNSGNNYNNSNSYNNSSNNGYNSNSGYNNNRSYEPRPYNGGRSDQNSEAQSRGSMPPPMPESAFNPGTDAEEDIPF